MTYAPGVSLETYHETYSGLSFPVEEVINDSRGAFVQIVSILIVSRIVDRDWLPITFCSSISMPSV